MAIIIIFLLIAELSKLMSGEFAEELILSFYSYYEVSLLTDYYSSIGISQFLYSYISYIFNYKTFIKYYK